MKKILISFCTCIIFLKIAGQSPAIDLASISEPMKKNAHSVVREEALLFEVKSIEKASYKIYQLITILDEAGKDELFFKINTDKFTLLEDFSVKLYSVNGKKIKEYSKNDLTTFASGEGLVSDGKVYLLDIPASSYPINVEYNYEIKFNGIIEYPDYKIQAVSQSVEKSSYTIIVPADLDLRYKAVNTDIVPVVSIENNRKTYQWKTHDMKALRYEEGSVHDFSYYPMILVSPNKFQFDGYPGEMTSWQKYGEWYNVLLKNTNDLSEDRKVFFRSLVKGAANDRVKAEIIYKYVQQNCRYVLILLGIGGFKPFEASFVDKKKYGDCKALSNYTQSCLAAVGIKSYQAIINSEYNKSPVDPNFPSDPFDHVILFIPIGTDSVWLECTSNAKEFGVLGSFTENRNALLITENGGKLVATPKSVATNNLSNTYCDVLLREDGSGTATVKLQTTGEYKYPDLLKEKKDDQKSYLVNYLGFLQPDDFVITQKEQSNDEYLVELELEKIPAFSAGSKQFLSPRIYKIFQAVLPTSENRTQDFYFHNPFIKNDTTVYKLPEGYTMEALPETKELNFEYGNFVSKYSYNKDKNELTTFAHLQLDNYRIPVAGYAKTKVFFDNVLAEYNTKIVIKRRD